MFEHKLEKKEDKSSDNLKKHEMQPGFSFGLHFMFLLFRNFHAPRFSFLLFVHAVVGRFLCNMDIVGMAFL